MRQSWQWQSIPQGTLWDERALAELNRRMKALEHSLKWMSGVVAAAKTLDAGETTPGVSSLRVLVTNNTGATTITKLLNGEPGQVLVLVMGDSKTTIQHNANIRLKGDVDWVGVLNQTRWVVTVDGTVWSEVPYA